MHMYIRSIIIMLIQFLGVALFLEGTGMVQNNSIIQPVMANQLQCISASKSANVGQFVAPNGNDITNNSSIVTVGNSRSPGFISLELNSTSFTRNNQGVYSCIIPDENGIQQFLHVGIYYGSFNSKLSDKLNISLFYLL